MGGRSRSPRRRRGATLLAAVVAATWAVTPGLALAATADGSDEAGHGGQAETAGSTGDAQSPPTAAIEVTVTPLVGEGRDDGDLVIVDEDAGFVALLFSPTAPAEQRAVHEVRVRNTGDSTLSDVVVSDDQMGTIVDAAAAAQLAPGEELVTRAAATFTFEEVATDRGGLFTSTTTATGTAEDGATVVDTATTRVELVAVLSTPSIDISLEVVPDAGDVEPADPPVVRWTAAQHDADEVRVVRYRVTVTNTSTVDLEEVAVTVDVLDEPVVATDEGVVLAPDETLVHEFDRELRPSELVDPTSAAAIVATEDATVDLPATATVTALDRTQDLTATARADATVRAVLAAAHLPAAGLDAPGAVPLLVVALFAGVVLLRWTRPITLARPTRPGADG